MEPTESSETSAYNNTLTPGTYPKEKKLQSKHGESLKSRIYTSNLTTMFNKRELYVGQSRGLLRMVIARLVVAVAYCNAGLS